MHYCTVNFILPLQSFYKLQESVSRRVIFFKLCCLYYLKPKMRNVDNRQQGKKKQNKMLAGIIL